MANIDPMGARLLKVAVSGWALGLQVGAVVVVLVATGLAMVDSRQRCLAGQHPEAALRLAIAVSLSGAGLLWVVRAAALLWMKRFGALLGSVGILVSEVCVLVAALVAIFAVGGPACHGWFDDSDDDLDLPLYVPGPH